ncbi:LysR family transcriptional regulator [Aliivibrio wodanis]|uniref:LysR family transcriptional regulator n=1 Tax=Aliivibrio wodanis TaxID=80852 RepID=UPI00406CDF2A
MFNLQQLETLVLCVECGSFSAAARRLGKAQSAVSTAIANLEIDAGIDIFDRSTRIPTLTPHGKRLYTHSIHLLSQAKEMKAMLHSFSVGVEDTLTIVINELLLTPNFFNIINSFYHEFPHTELHINTADNKEISQLIAQGNASIGFMLCEDFIPQDVELGLVGYLPISATAAIEHPLHEQVSTTLDELKGFRQILLNNMQGPWNIHFSPLITRTNDLNTLQSLLAANNSWSFVPDHIIEKNNAIKIIELDSEEKNWLLHIDRAVPKNKNMGQAFTWLYQKSIHMFEVQSDK